MNIDTHTLTHCTKSSKMILMELSNLSVHGLVFVASVGELQGYSVESSMRL